MSLARRGPLAILSIVTCLMTAIGFAVVAIVLAMRSRESVWDVPLLASSALAWGGGFLHAFGSAAHALRKDRVSGIKDLVVTRTGSLGGYLFARVGGLAAMIAITVGGGTLFAGLVATIASASGMTSRTMQSTLAAFMFALAFSGVIAPLAYAAVGARSRVGGYLFLIGVVVLPELVASALEHVLPRALTEVLAIPSALATLRTSLEPGSFELLRFVRALVALVVFATLAMLLVRREAIVLEETEGA